MSTRKAYKRQTKISQPCCKQAPRTPGQTADEAERLLLKAATLRAEVVVPRYNWLVCSTRGQPTRRYRAWTSPSRTHGCTQN